MRLFGFLVLSAALLGTPAMAQEVLIRDLGRFAQDREIQLSGVGLVMGLTGTGDNPRNQATRRALSNALSRMNFTVDEGEIQSRNVALVAVTATLPSTVHAGDRIDVAVSTVGDARSLAGGQLVRASLAGPDGREYAIAQGPLVVGGFREDSSLNREQRNFPGAAVAPGAGTVQVSLSPAPATPEGDLVFVLKHPDVTTAERVSGAINASLGPGSAQVQDRASVLIRGAGRNPFQLAAFVENLGVQAPELSRIVISERSGTVVAGGAVRISSVVISQGDIRVSVEAVNEASQPGLYAGRGGEGVRSLVVTNTRLAVGPEREDAMAVFPSSTVADLVQGLRDAKVDTRGMISILQAMKAAGALHADIVVQ